MRLEKTIFTLAKAGHGLVIKKEEHAIGMVSKLIRLVQLCIVNVSTIHQYLIYTSREKTI